MRTIADWFGLVEAPGTPRVLVLGCPFDAAASGRTGAAQGPDAIRRWARTSEAVAEDGTPVHGVRVLDCGDAPGPGASITEAAAGILGRYPGAFLLGLGGDHSVMPALVQAVRDHTGRLAVVVLDAHPDLFDEYEGRRDSHACALARLWEQSGIAPEHTALVGVRSFALPELDPLRSSGLVISAAEWHRIGSRNCADRIRAALGERPLYVSLDIDVLDPSAAPGTGYPVAGGPGWRQLLDLLARLYATQRVVAMDLVEVAPPLDHGEITVAGAAQLLLQVIASMSASGGPAGPR